MAPTKKDYTALIVDDDPRNIAINMKYLSRNGFETKLAKNGQEAVEYFQRDNKKQCHLVIMKLEMPVMDGFQATKEIRALGVKSLIIGTSGSTTTEAKVQELVNAGIDGYFPRPMNMAKLAAIVGRVQLIHNKA